MVKKINDTHKHPESKEDPNVRDHDNKYQKKYKKGHFPTRFWPTDSSKSKHKGQKI